MIDHTYNLTAAVATSALPTSLLVDPLHAWALLGVVLVLSCSVLWYLTKPRDDQQLGPETPTRTRPAYGPRPGCRSNATRSLEAQRLHA